MNNRNIVDPEVSAALDVARGLAAAGIPLFVARPFAEGDDEHWRKVGFVLPAGWNSVAPDPRVVEHWAPGMALCAVMGAGLDLLDIDPRSGGALPIDPPHAYAASYTPGGGAHLFVKSMGVGSRDGVWPGVDVKGGNPDGSGRGFAFLAPTVKSSKGGEPRPYRWVRIPSNADLVANAGSPVWTGANDQSVTTLAAAVVAAKAKSGAAPRQSAPHGLTGELAAFADQRVPHSTARADQAIATALAELAAMPAQTGAGFRTAVLKAAMTLGGYVGAGHVTEVAAREELLGAITGVWGHADADDELWVQQGLTDGAGRPFAVYDAVDAVFDGGTEGGGGAPDAVTEEQRRKFRFYDVIGRHPFDPAMDDSDQGLADAVLERTRPGLRRALDTGGWIVRGPTRWEELGDAGRAEWAVSVLARVMPPGRKAAASEDKTEDHWRYERRAKFVKTAGSGAIAGKMRAISGGADHPSVVRVAELDSEAEVLWAGGVPWDLRLSGVAPVPAPIDPGTPHLHSAAVTPAPGPTPLWDAFLASVWPDPGVRAWALRVMSISLTGHPDAAVPVFYGPERTGKSSFVSILVKLLGSYAHAADPRLLGAVNAHASIVYALKGRRLSFIDEGPRRGQLATERLKQLTGGTELTGNAMNQNPITFAPTHTLVMTTNDEPQISDAALAARIRIIPCEGDQAAVRAARYALTPAALEMEGPAILAALMREAAAWIAAPDTALTAAAPATVRELVAEIAGDQDQVGAWVRERTRPDAHGTKVLELYAAFEAWWESSPSRRKAQVPTMTAWGRSLNSLGVEKTRHADGIYRHCVLSSGGDVTWAVDLALNTSVHSAAQSGVPSVQGSATPATSVNAETVNTVNTSLCSVDSHTTTTTQNKNRGEHRGDRSSVQTVQAKTPPYERASVPPSAQPGPGALIICPGCSGSIELTKALKFKVHKSGHERGAPRCEGSGQLPPGVLTVRERNAQARERAKLDKIAAAAGGLLVLPAAMRRGEAPRSVSDAAEIVRAGMARNQGRLSVDVESNARPLWHPGYRTRTIQLGDWAEAVCYDANDPAQLTEVAALLAEATELDAHSYTADGVPLARLGVIEYDAFLAKAVDTATLAKLADPMATDNGDGLKELSAFILGAAAVSPAAEDARKALGDAAGWIWKLKHDTPDERNGWLQVDSRCATMVAYACADVLDCSALRIKLPQPDPAVLKRELIAQRVVAKLPYLGLAIDGPGVRAQLAEREPRAAEKLARIQALGVANPDSPKQLTQRLTELGAHLPKTDAGNDTAADDVLAKLVHAPGELGELAALVRAYRDDATVLKNMIRPWARSVDGGDCRTYPTIYTLGADTGRMSCVRPNLQQVAREGGLRECIAADPGYLLISADFSSVEVRVAAYVSGDQNLIAMIHQGIDLHSMIAERAYGPNFTKADRYNVKRVVFGRLYGGSAPTLAAQTGLTVDMVNTLIEVLDALAPRLRAWSEEIKRAVRSGATEYRTYAGRVIHLDKRFPHKAPNWIIQGTARELLIDALVKWDAGPYRGGLVLPVHDEIVAMVPEAQAANATRFLTLCMTSQLGPVPITVEADEPAREWQSAA